MDSAAEKAIIRIASPYLDDLIVHKQLEGIGISTFWSSHLKPLFT
jgi:hypothetical protein